MLAARLAGCSVRIAHSHTTTCKYKVIDKIMKPIFDSSCTHNIACGKEAGKWLFGRAEFEIFKMVYLQKTIDLMKTIGN